MSTSWSTTQIIGRLIPVNKEAKRAFNDVAKAVRCDEASTEAIDLRHASQFMVINSNLQVWANATDTTTDDNASSTEALTDVDAGTTENDSESPKPIPLEFQGYYSLSFKQLPYSPPFGWLIGVGRKDNASTSRSTRKVDIQLALQEFRKRYEVAGWHAHISFDREMGSLVVAAASGRCPELVLGSDQITRGQRVVTQVKNRVKFGRLEYSLEFDTSDANGYQKALSEFFEQHLNSEAPPAALSATPSPFDLVLGDWYVRATIIGKGTFGTVNPTRHTKRNEPAAAKVFERSESNYKAIAEEIAVLKALPVHDRILRICHVEYERSEKYTHILVAEKEKVAIIFSPLVKKTFAHQFPEPAVRLLAFNQILQGIHALHYAGFIHRDIKKENLGMVSFSDTNVNTAILDYGHTIQTTVCEPDRGHIGTISYLAPEMEEFRYTSAVDIWACGIFGYCLLVNNDGPGIGGLPWKGNIIDPRNRNAWEAIMRRLFAADKNSVENLLGQMLLWTPTIRISAEDALKHPCFANMIAESPPVPVSQPGQKRTIAQVNLSQANREMISPMP